MLLLGSLGILAVLPQCPLFCILTLLMCVHFPFLQPHPTTHHAIAQPGTPHSHIPQPSLPISMAASAAATMVAMANTTPCTTLFLGNLGSQTSESELHEELSR